MFFFSLFSPKEAFPSLILKSLFSFCVACIFFSLFVPSEATTFVYIPGKKTCNLKELPPWKRRFQIPFGNSHHFQSSRRQFFGESCYLQNLPARKLTFRQLLSLFPVGKKMSSWTLKIRLKLGGWQVWPKDSHILNVLELQLTLPRNVLFWCI